MVVGKQLGAESNASLSFPSARPFCSLLKEVVVVR